MTLDLWRVLRPGGALPSVLAFDFGPGRAGAGFADLVELLPEDVPVLEAVPPDELDAVDTVQSVEARLRLLVDGITAEGREVAVAVGYCAGSAPARSAAALLGATGRPAPQVVLVDPETVDRLTLVQAYETALSSLRGMDRGLADEPPLPAGWADDAGEPVADTRLLLDSYVTTVTASFARMKLPAKLGAQLGARFHRYLAYLLMSALTPAAPAAGVRILGSAGYVLDPLFTGELRRLDVDRDRMLATPAVAEEVRRAVEAHESTWREVVVTRGAGYVQQ
ncbi:MULTISPECIES: hypothetical protein [Micromonospora]|uniref:hypothetical protein n=1 Tax=Micromonospora TaxID=1873 RepID=UPI001AEAF1C2|nr:MULTISPECIES: hypothetical protein [unclassified Micromonospora]MBP1780674.1 hypothetical protein [Micromonospora sp. HB375]MDH6468898.1 hypothetical protein [Micromonospora sp. H404/HB375]